MYDADGGLLYVGKAKDLAKRLRQYVDLDKLEYHKILMRRQVALVEWSIAESEQAALVAEQRLIKTMRPKYNIILKDDKTYPYLVLSNDEFPRLYRERRKYSRAPHPARFAFGPFPFIKDLDETIKLVQKICRVRACANTVFASRRRPCILYQTGRCSAPCADMITATEYRKQTAMARNIMRGHVRLVVSTLAKKMAAAAKARDYEAAAKLKCQIESLHNTTKTDKIENKIGKI